MHHNHSEVIHLELIESVSNPQSLTMMVSAVITNPRSLRRMHILLFQMDRAKTVIVLLFCNRFHRALPGSIICIYSRGGYSSRIDRVIDHDRESQQTENVTGMLFHDQDLSKYTAISGSTIVSYNAEEYISNDLSRIPRG